MGTTALLYSTCAAHGHAWHSTAQPQAQAHASAGRWRDFFFAKGRGNGSLNFSLAPARGVLCRCYAEDLRVTPDEGMHSSNSWWLSTPQCHSWCSAHITCGSLHRYSSGHLRRHEFMLCLPCLPGSPWILSDKHPTLKVPRTHTHTEVVATNCSTHAYDFSSP
jgi:hypothetical protein